VSRAASNIEINGTTYDTASGNVVGTVKKVASQVKDQSRAIDGFVRKAGNQAKATAEAVKPKPAVNRAVTSAKKVHSRTQRSHALMRTVVTKPQPEALQPSVIKPSVSHAVGVEQERRSRANAVVKNHHVKRFGS